MLQIGKNIVSTNDALLKKPQQEVFELIKNPPGNLKSVIEQLRVVRTIDEQKYRKFKRKLPYFTCGIFNPPYRHTKNFASIASFVIDIDHISEKGLSIDNLKISLTADERIVMLFISPGNDGLKILFNLSEKCFDHARFKIFYKLFLRDFATKNNIEMLADSRTSDVTRACFLSYDMDAYFNPSAIPVEMNTFIDFESPTETDAALALFKTEEKKAPVLANIEKIEIDDEIYDSIKQKLNPAIKTKAEKIIYVPDKLETVISAVENRIKEFGIILKEITDIHYGKKMRFILKDNWAEINLFYGKRGFSVVKTPKRGSDARLADIVHQILCEMFIEQ